MKSQDGSASKSGSNKSILQDVVEEIFALPFADASEMAYQMHGGSPLAMLELGEIQTGVERIITEAQFGPKAQTAIWALVELSKKINEALDYLSGMRDMNFAEQNFEIPVRCQEAESKISNHHEVTSRLLNKLDSMTNGAKDMAFESLFPEPSQPFSVWDKQDAFFPYWLNLSNPEHKTRAILMRVLTVRVRPDARKLCREILKWSVDWPITISHAADGRSKRLEEYIQSLNLGHALGLRIQRKKRKGKHPEFRPGTPLMFALEFYEYIEYYRWLRNHAPWRNLMERNFRDDPEVPMNKYGMLPDLSSDPVVFEDWVKKAKSRLETLCGPDKWDKYEWPECVVKRHSKRPHQSIQAAANEMLKDGFELLVSYKLGSSS